MAGHSPANIQGTGAMPRLLASIASRSRIITAQLNMASGMENCKDLVRSRENKKIRKNVVNPAEMIIDLLLPNL